MLLLSRPRSECADSEGQMEEVGYRLWDFIFRPNLPYHFVFQPMTSNDSPSCPGPQQSQEPDKQPRKFLWRHFRCTGRGHDNPIAKDMKLLTFDDLSEDYPLCELLGAHFRNQRALYRIDVGNKSLNQFKLGRLGGSVG